MKIVDRKTFLAMPENTLFSKWETCCFDKIQIKMETCYSDSLQSDDFFVQEISEAFECSDVCSETSECICEKGESIKPNLNTLKGRYGYFDEDRPLFAVWEQQDVLALIERLKMCVKEGVKE